MNEAHELAEKIEQAAHAGGHGEGHGGGIGRVAGLTMAILGVMLALCAALVGGARTELISTMVEQSNTYQKYQAQQMKHRMMITQLATLHALSPSRKEVGVFDKKLAAMHAAEGKEDTPEQAQLKAMIQLQTDSIVELLQPRVEDEKRLIEMSKKYAEQTEAASKWAESYEPAVAAHEEAAEHFEWGQLAAEIGIVIASVALLLNNRKAWYLSLVFGTICAVTLAGTYLTTHQHARSAEEEVAKSKGIYEKMRKEQSSGEEDKEIVAALEKRIHDKEAMSHP